MLLGLLLSASYWVDIGDKQALVCDINNLPQCVQQLPDSIQRTLEQNNIQQAMAYRDAMVIPVSAPQISGVIFLRPADPQTQLVSFIEGTKISLELKQQSQLSLWHEQGHLQNEQVISSILNRQLTPSEHEAFADLFMVWQSVQTSKNFDLVWQQYHRRNLNVINQESDYSHWSVPLLHHVINQYTPEQIIRFDTYSNFAKHLINRYHPLSSDEQREFRSLIKHLFHSHSTFNQRCYLSWRREKFSAYLAPTLTALLKQEQARAVFEALELPLNNTLNPS